MCFDCFYCSVHRGAGEGNAQRSEAAGTGHGRRGQPHPEAQKPHRQVSDGPIADTRY